MFLNKPELAAVHVLASIKKAAQRSMRYLDKNSRSRSICCSVSLLILRVSHAGVRVNNVLIRVEGQDRRVNTSYNQSCSAIMGLYRRHPPWMARVGEWLSLVEHLVRDQGVGGSNPLSPTISFQSFASLRGPPPGFTSGALGSESARTVGFRFLLDSTCWIQIPARSKWL
jgi:hypothetical protein